MDIDKLAKETILKNMTPEQQKAVLESVMASVQESKKARSVKIAENVDLVMQALKKIEAKMLARVNKAAELAETAAKNVKDGKDGRDGANGKDGNDGKTIKGDKGDRGDDGKDGKDGRDGVDGVSVVNAFLDFDNSLVIELSNGKQINVGGILADDTAEKVRVVANGGGTSQGVLDALAALQTEIDNLIPSQTGNAGKFLSTDGTNLSWVGGGGGLSYEGTWNASTNSPTLTSGVGTNGYYYVVSTTGTTNLDGITSWTVGDWVIFNGINWQKIDNTDLVTSVAGRTGDVTLTNSDVSGSAASGANSDITSLSGLTGSISNPTYIQMGSGSGTTLAAGRIWYDQTTGSINAGMGGGNITQQIGEELFIYGKASSAITEGQLIVKTGAVGASGVITFAPSPTGLTDNDGILGLATENIASGGFGRITTFGVVHGITTTGASVGETWADGDVLYYNPSYVGGLTKVKPSSPYAKFQVGVVINAGSGGSGSIQVDLIPGSVLGGTDSNVQTNGLANGNLLTYNGSGSYWKNTALMAGTGISVSAASDGALTVTNTINLASPGAIGGTTPAAGTFTTLIGGKDQVNYGQLTGGATTKAVEFKSLGSDTNVALAIKTQGTGAIDLAAGSSGVNISNGGTVTAITRTAGGSGYATAPDVTISAPTTAGGVQATATVAVSAGAITTFTITNAGSGYVEQPTVSFSGGGGSGAAAYATVGSDTAVRSIGANMSFYSPNGEQLRLANTGASNVNYLYGYGAATNSTPTFGAFGSDTNVSLNLIAKGAGNINFYTNFGGAAVAQMRVSHTASAVNYVQVTGAATGGAPIISAQGSDSNIDLRYNGKGTSGHIFYNGSGYAQFRIIGSVNAVNYLQSSGSLAGVAPVLSAQGSDTNIDLALTPKGTGRVKFGTYTSLGSTTFSIDGYIEIVDSGGTVRKLAVLV